MRTLTSGRASEVGAMRALKVKTMSRKNPSSGNREISSEHSPVRYCACSSLGGGEVTEGGARAA